MSIIVPIKNEAGNIAGLIREIVSACSTIPVSYEIVVVDDKSTDGSLAVLNSIAQDVPNLHILAHDRNGGQSAAVHSGVLNARGRIICTLDGDGQNPPAEIPKLVTPFFDHESDTGLGLVAGQRLGRHDTLSKRLASKFANHVRGYVLKDGTRDTGCGLKAFPKAVFLELPYFNHMHRYLPALVTRAGYSIIHVDVAHRPRGAGRSNYSNLQRAFVGIWDLLGMMWLIRRAKVARVIKQEGQD